MHIGLVGVGRWVKKHLSVLNELKKANQINLAFNDMLKSDLNYYKDSLNLSFSILKTIEILKKNRI